MHMYTFQNSRVVGHKKKSKLAWLKHWNHNMMRITRILESTRILGFESERTVLADILTAIYAGHSKVIGVRTWKFWQQHFPGKDCGLF